MHNSSNKQVLYFVKTTVGSVIWGPDNIEEFKKKHRKDIIKALAEDVKQYYTADTILPFEEIDDDYICGECPELLGEFDYMPHGEPPSLDYKDLPLQACLEKLSHEKKNSSNVCNGATVEMDGKKYKVTLTLIEEG